MKEGLAEQLGLVSKEVSIVMTDVQGSSRLWEWYATSVLPLLADMHCSPCFDSCFDGSAVGHLHVPVQRAAYDNPLQCIPGSYIASAE